MHSQTVFLSSCSFSVWLLFNPGTKSPDPIHKGKQMTYEILGLGIYPDNAWLTNKIYYFSGLFMGKNSSTLISEPFPKSQVCEKQDTYLVYNITLVYHTTLHLGV